ncbi:MAG: 16S rRNA processing protein RimM [Rhodospirillales bacterium]|nr:16S rRNA processing protein RimM [Rhodospirillales bacterium]
MAAQKRICLGVVVGAHGIKGSVRIKSYTQRPEDIAAYGPLTDADGRGGYKVRVERNTPKGIIARIGGIDDRDAAIAAKGLALYVERDRLPAEDEDEYYFVDLIGLPVEREDGSPLGVVKTMDNFGAGNVMEVELKDGGSVVIPFTRAAVPVVDIKAGRIVAIPPESLMTKGQKESNESKE